MKGLLRLEVEKLHNDRNDADNISEGGSMTNELHDVGELNNGRHSRNSVDGTYSSQNSSAIAKKDTHQNGQSSNAENGDNVTRRAPHPPPFCVEFPVLKLMTQDYTSFSVYMRCVLSCYSFKLSTFG